MNEETTRWQLVTSANPASAVLPGCSSLLLFVGRAAFVYAPGELTQQCCLPYLRPMELLAKTSARNYAGDWWRNINLPRKIRKISHYFCRIAYYLA
jgi:hypothetical protein